MYGNGNGNNNIGNGIEHIPKFELSHITNVKDKKFMQEIILYCQEHDIEYDESRSIIFDLATKFGLSIFEDVADVNNYTRHNCKNCHLHQYKENKFELATDITKSFIIDFGNWIWEYNEERDMPIRRVWYLKYKQLMQILYLENHDLKTPFNEHYSALLSKTLWSMIKNNPNLFYGSFSIKDMSRSIWYYPKLGWENIIIFGEKDATTPYFKKTCEILGIRILASGSGKNSAAAAEKLFTESVKTDFDINYPIYVFTLTDYDRDGIKGVESGFVKQIKEFADRCDYEVVHERVGVNIEDIPEEDRTPLGNCFVLPNQSDKWTRENGIPYIKEDGTTQYLGIELEALPTNYFYNKILDTIYLHFDQEQMTEYIRHKTTPEEWEYSSISENVAFDYVFDTSYDHKVLEFEKNILQNMISNIEDAQLLLCQSLIDELNNISPEVYNKDNFDDRSREWDNDLGDWNIEITKELYLSHKTKIESAVLSQSPFLYESIKGLGLLKQDLLDKLSKILSEKIQDGDIDTSSVNKSEYITEIKEEYTTIIIKNKSNNEDLDKTVKQLVKNVDMKILLSVFNKLMGQYDEYNELTLFLEDDEISFALNLTDYLNENLEVLDNDE